jgi:biotin-dependent carboxylase-like uncharacterized protein
LWTQKLLNQQNINALEVMVGLKLEVTTSTIISICGADLSFQINGKSKPIWQTHNIKKGDILSFLKRRRGQRAYLAIKGGFVLEKAYGSYATTIKENISSKLKRGNFLKFKSSTHGEIRRVQKAFIPSYPKHLKLRLLLSYQEDYFSKEEQEKFFNSTYEITLQSDRMGAKLKGQTITPKATGIISEGIAFGSVQIPKDGQPILLLKERQTIGGYPKIGTVLAIDCYKFSQLAVADTVSFEKINLESTREKMLKFSQYFSKKTIDLVPKYLS